MPAIQPSTQPERVAQPRTKDLGPKAFGKKPEKILFVHQSGFGNFFYGYFGDGWGYSLFFSPPDEPMTYYQCEGWASNEYSPNTDSPQNRPHLHTKYIFSATPCGITMQFDNRNMPKDGRELENHDDYKWWLIGGIDSDNINLMSLPQEHWIIYAAKIDIKTLCRHPASLVVTEPRYGRFYDENGIKRRPRVFLVPEYNYWQTQELKVHQSGWYISQEGKPVFQMNLSNHDSNKCKPVGELHTFEAKEFNSGGREIEMAIDGNRLELLGMLDIRNLINGDPDRNRDIFTVSRKWEPLKAPNIKVINAKGSINGTLCKNSCLPIKYPECPSRLCLAGRNLSPFGLSIRTKNRAEVSFRPD